LLSRADYWKTECQSRCEARDPERLFNRLILHGHQDVLIIHSLRILISRKFLLELVILPGTKA
jgi:hypothetical protein